VFGAKDSLDVAGPIDSNDWIYFVKLDERRDGQTTGFDQAKAQIAQQLQRRKRLDTYNQFVETLKKDTAVQTFPDRIQEAVQASLKQSGPPMGPVSLVK
jgi:parvulin-like peptidyl-prolyl isomerase